jgi:hypothetical protein
VFLAPAAGREGGAIQDDDVALQVRVDPLHLRVGGELVAESHLVERRARQRHAVGFSAALISSADLGGEIAPRKTSAVEIDPRIARRAQQEL